MNTFIIKYYIIGYGVLMITYLLLNLFLLHKFSSGNIKIPEILPQFIINWLKEFEVVSQSKISIQSFKETIYINMVIYLFSIIFVVLIS